MRKILEYIVVLLIILRTNSIYAVMVSPINKIILLSLIATLFLLCLLNITNNKTRFNCVNLVIFFFFYICNVSVLLINVSDSSFIPANSIRFFALFPLLIIYFQSIPENYDILSILKAGINIMVVEALLSMFFYFFGSIFGIIHPTGSVVIDWGGVFSVNSYYGIYFDPQFLRNNGCFAEAPMHSFALSTMYLAECFLDPNRKKWKIIVFVLALLTTTSTTGMLVLIATAGYYLFTLCTKSKVHVYLKLLLVFLFFASLAGLYILTADILAEKSTGLSYSVRQERMLRDLKVWLENPFFGAGYGAYHSGNSNSITLMLAEGGVHLFFLYAIPLIILPIYFSIKDKKIEHIVFFAVFYGMFCITLVLYSPLTLFIMSIPIARVLRKKLEFSSTVNSG